METPEYSARLGRISPAQFQAALDALRWRASEDSARIVRQRLYIEKPR